MKKSFSLSQITLASLLALSVTGCSAEAIQALNSALTKIPTSQQQVVTQKSPTANTKNTMTPACGAMQMQSVGNGMTAAPECAKPPAPHQAVPTPGGCSSMKVQHEGFNHGDCFMAAGPAPDKKLNAGGDCSTTSALPGDPMAPNCQGMPPEPPSKEVLDTDFEI